MEAACEQEPAAPKLPLVSKVLDPDAHLACFPCLLPTSHFPHSPYFRQDLLPLLPSPAMAVKCSRRLSEISFFTPKKEKGEPERAGSLLSSVQALMPRLLHPQPLPGEGGSQGAGDTILGVHNAGRPAAAFPAPDFYHLEEGDWPGCLARFCNYTLQICVLPQGLSRLNPRTHTFFIHVAFSLL